jgi:hypothetical protein
MRAAYGIMEAKHIGRTAHLLGIREGRSPVVGPRHSGLGWLPEADAEHALLSGRSRAEARKHLLLVNMGALGSASERTCAFAALDLRAYSNLCLVAGVLQDRSIPTECRLSEGRRGRHKHKR